MTESLKKKLGPLPVWAWALIAFAGIWYYRNKVSSSTAATSTTAADATPPQAPVVLQPGESIYDPNTNQLLGGDGSSGGSGAGTGGGTGNYPGNYPDGIALPAYAPPGTPTPPGLGKIRKPSKRKPKRSRATKAKKPSVSHAHRLTIRPRSGTHLRGPRTQAVNHAHRLTTPLSRIPAQPGAASKAQPHGGGKAPTKSRKGLGFKRAVTTKNQRPTATMPPTKTSVTAHRSPTPSRAPTRNVNRHVHTEGPPRKSRPRGQK